MVVGKHGVKTARIVVLYLMDMVSTREQMMDSVTSRILLFCAQNRVSAGLSRNNGAISAEDVFAELFNIIYRDSHASFINANKIKINYPGIDLLDTDNKTAIQITVQNSLKKVKDSFSKIPAFSDNRDYSRVEFFIQDNKITLGMKRFGPKYKDYDVEVYCASDVLRDVDSIGKQDHLKDVCEFVEKSINVPNRVTAEKDIDNEAFGILFQALKDRVESKDIVDAKDPMIVYKSSPKEKKDKFKSDWEKLVNLYKNSLGMKDKDEGYKKLIDYEKQITECFSEDLDEIQKDLILKYLRTQSLIILEENPNKPLIAIEGLTKKIKSDFNVGFLSKTQVMSFILNMFFACDVFPLEFKQDEEV
jgi:hypothetical protein